MFYPSLGRLRDSEEAALVDRLDEKLALLFRDQRRRIAPSYISRELDVSLNDATRVLVKAADAGVGEFAYEVMCRECGVTSRTYGELGDVPVDEVAQCSSCDEEYAISSEGIWVSFRITAEPTKKAGAPSDEAGGAGGTRLEELLAVPFFADDYLPDQLYKPDRGRLRELLATLDEEAETSKEHGDALEAFAREFLGSCKLFQILKVSRVSIGQIDVACRVKVYPSLVTQDWNSYLVAECKNQKDKVGFPELAKLVAKMQGAKTNTGLAVATEGVTGNWDLFQDALGYVRERFLDDQRILCFVRDDLERLVGGENLLSLLQEKLDLLHFPPHTGR